jgi:hypothetical protein
LRRTVRRTPRQEILSEVFSYRADALDLLWRIAPSSTGSELRLASEKLAEGAVILGGSPAAKTYRSCADLYECVALLLDWGAAVRMAEMDADRYLRAAQLRARDLIGVLTSTSDADYSVLMQVASQIANVTSVEEISDALAAIRALPLPIAIFRVEESRIVPRGNDGEIPPSEYAVAVAQFFVDGEPVGLRRAIRPHILHDLSVELRLSRWPEGAESVRLEPLTIESPDSYEMPSFSFTRPATDPPFLLNDRARMRLRVAQSLRSRPMEFHYTLTFYPLVPLRGSSVEGQRTLRFEAIDPSLQPLTGYASLDERLFQLRDILRQQGGIPEADMQSFLILLRRLAQLAAHARSDNRFPGTWSERDFQREAKSWLRGDPEIGGALEEHPLVGGGETDLSFRGIRLELKVEPHDAIDVDGAARHFAQATQYAATSGKRLALLSVLECAEKEAPLGALESDVAFRQVAGDRPIVLGVVVVRGNLPRPSDL